MAVAGPTKEPKVEFQEPYVLVMSERAPKMFRDLIRSGHMEEHLQQKSTEAHRLYRELLAQYPNPGLREEREAGEQVFALMIDFPPECRPERAEPPDNQ
jgi:hypothetical protein